MLKLIYNQLRENTAKELHPEMGYILNGVFLKVILYMTKLNNELKLL